MIVHLWYCMRKIGEIFSTYIFWINICMIINRKDLVINLVRKENTKINIKKVSLNIHFVSQCILHTHVSSYTVFMRTLSQQSVIFPFNQFKSSSNSQFIKCCVSPVTNTRLLIFYLKKKKIKHKMRWKLNEISGVLFPQNVCSDT